MQTKIFASTLFTRRSLWFFLNDAQITLIDKAQASIHTKREHFWMRTLETYYPHGLNIEETYQCLLLCWSLARLCTCFGVIMVYFVKCINALLVLEKLFQEKIIRTGLQSFKFSFIISSFYYFIIYYIISYIVLVFTHRAQLLNWGHIRTS